MQTTYEAKLVITPKEVWVKFGSYIHTKQESGICLDLWEGRNLIFLGSDVDWKGKQQNSAPDYAVNLINFTRLLRFPSLVFSELLPSCLHC